VQAVDVAGSDAKLLLELKRAATEELADAVVVGAPVTYDETLGRAIDLAALPVLFTQPLDPSGRAGASWTFALAPPHSRIASAQIDDALRRDVLTPSIVLTGGRERIDPMASALASEAERRRLDPLTRIAVASDGSVPPVVRSSLSVLRSVHCLAPVSVCSAVAREARSLGSPAMIYLPYLTSAHEHVRDDRDLASRAVWPSSRTLIPSTALATPAQAARASFLKDYGGRWNAWPDIHGAIAFDALSLLAAVADDGGADDRVALRNRLGAIRMPLIASTYAFGDGRRGPDPADLTWLRWDAGAPAIAPTFGTVAPTPSPTPGRTASPSPTASP
jgi:hypothetical protein